VTQLFVPHIGWLEFPDGDDVARFLAEGWFEYAEQAFFWLYLRPGDAVLDAGAHAGLYTLLAAQAAPGGRIDAVEPNPVLADLAERNLLANGLSGAVIHRAALAETAGEGFLTPDVRGPAYGKLGEAGDDNCTPAVLLTVDKLLGGRAVTLAKFDIEGAEPRALAGARGAIAAGQLPVLMVECTRANLEASGSSPAKLAGQLSDLGYTVCRFEAPEARLVPMAQPGREHENLFAVRDLAAVNLRLREADPQRRRIAGDLIRHGAAAERLAAQRDALTAAQVRLQELERAYAEIGAARWTIAEQESRLAEITRQRDARGGEIAALHEEIRLLRSAGEQRQLAMEAALEELQKNLAAAAERAAEQEQALQSAARERERLASALAAAGERDACHRKDLAAAAERAAEQEQALQSAARERERLASALAAAGERERETAGRLAALRSHRGVRLLRALRLISSGS
jgi:FkbM family methyltransferase